MLDDDPTPAGVIRSTWRWFPAWVVVLFAACLLIGGLTYAGHVFGWWLSAQDATHQAQNTQNGYSNQTTLRAQVTSQLAAVETITTQIAAAGNDTSLTTALKAQRAGIAGIVCSDAAQISGTPLPAQQAQWASVNCADGAVSPQSPLYQAGQP
ncbi:MAG TPA: hypothetical protein VK586_02845 [Streptosporangiaceae bacterium]|nr:hypothetical protein [Streptosporangiaceae bacterium]